MTSPIPVNPNLKSAVFNQEPNSYSSFADSYQFFQPRRLKVSKQSPPVLNVDVTEGEIVWDRTLLRIYTVSDNVLRYVQFT